VRTPARAGGGPQRGPGRDLQGSIGVLSSHRAEWRARSGSFRTPQSPPGMETMDPNEADPRHTLWRGSVASRGGVA
jgi:hypothetical protein